MDKARSYYKTWRKYWKYCKYCKYIICNMFNISVINIPLFCKRRRKLSLFDDKISCNNG